MKESQKGFVLLIVLVFLQLCSSLSLFGLSSVSIALRSMANLSAREKNERLVDQILMEVEKGFEDELPNCMIPVSLPSEISQKPFSWWQLNACSGNLNEILYYYVVENLGNDACALMEKYDINQVVTVGFYRITLFSMMKPQTVIIQSTWALNAQDENFSCKTEPHSVQLGRQMRRELIGRSGWSQSF